MIKKINNKNLILGAACGYDWDDLKIFIKSLRKFINCRVILIFEHALDKSLKNKFKNYIINSKKNNPCSQKVYHFRK